MLQKVLDRLEGINKDRLNKELVELILTAEEMGLECKKYLYESGTRDTLLKKYDEWQAVIDGFYEKFVK
ncbi:MAG: hypothetical protein HQ517_01205 [SAR324 cluster bacterium]|nr:hypothetical protein [SAR324 cluster bacterium]